MKIEPVSQDFQLMGFRKISYKTNDGWSKKGLQRKKAFSASSHCNELSNFVPSFYRKVQKLHPISHLMAGRLEKRAEFSSNRTTAERIQKRILLKITKSVICTNVILGIPANAVVRLGMKRYKKSFTRRTKER